MTWTQWAAVWLGTLLGGGVGVAIVLVGYLAWERWGR